MVEPITAALRRAAELTAAGQPLAAVAVLRPVLAENPDNSEAWCRLSAACLDAGHADESLDAAKRAITLGERSWGHRLASLALIELGRREEAVISAREAVRRDPEEWRSHVALAEALDGMNPAEAVQAARRGAELSNGVARPYEVLGDVALHAHDVAAAREAYRRALVIDPTSDHARTSLRGLAGTVGSTPAPALPAAQPPPPRSRRTSRRALLLIVRRVAGWQAVGSFVLILAGIPSPSHVLAWAGVLLLVLLAYLGVRGWFAAPAPARVAPVALVRASPVLAGACALTALGLVLLVLACVTIAVSAWGLGLLVTVAVCSLLASGLATLGIRPVRAR
ncbi:tetratricopeptide repeat protein [Labedaea rhizosphaerae]|uniref:Tetratricopeptide repeat protein n=1 Tax=Labedaea rhizosphaerae TaxID=598644 RepID=A0A4R6SD57_LABRH|nr:tetratricopeptide repeat protein [Labedaea rhizosphaerae]TDP97870.1 tetratricopeptide repeat protein [Labedaea rhizosphaerae]